MKRIFVLLLALLPLPAAAQNLTTGNFAHFVTSAATASGPFSTSDFFIMSRGNAPFRVPASTFFPGGPFMLPNASNSSTTTSFNFGSPITPFYATAATTTANTVNGSSNIIVASATGIRLGDVVSATSPSFLPVVTACWVSGIAGTTITLTSISGTCNATGTNTGASVTFGTNNRWTAGTSLLTNTLGVSTGYFGEAANGHSSWIAKYFGGGDFSLNWGLQATAPAGGFAGGVFAAKTSGNSTSTANIAPLESLLVDDNSATSHGSGNYFESDLVAFANGSGHIQNESSIYNQTWTAGDLNPYVDNHVGDGKGQIENYRIDCGIGSGTPLPCSTPIHILTNGSNYIGGIIFGDGSLSTAFGGVAEAMELPKNYAIDWWSGASNVAWRLYSSATADNSTINMQNGGLIQTSTLAATGPYAAYFNGTNTRQMNVGVIDGFNGGINVIGGGILDIQNAGVPVFQIGSLNSIVVNNKLNFTAVNNTHAMLTGSGTALKVRLGDDSADGGFTVGSITASANYQNNGVVFMSATPPTIASGGCTTGSAQSISASNGTAAFEITLGGATCGSTITLTMPTAVNGWVCDAHNITNPATNVLDQNSTGTTSVVLQNYVRTTGVGGNFTGADHLIVKCSAY